MYKLYKEKNTDGKQFIINALHKLPDELLDRMVSEYAGTAFGSHLAELQMRRALEEMARTA